MTDPTGTVPELRLLRGETPLRWDYIERRDRGRLFLGGYGAVVAHDHLVLMAGSVRIAGFIVTSYSSGGDFRAEDEIGFAMRVGVTPDGRTFEEAT